MRWLRDLRAMYENRVELDAKEMLVEFDLQEPRGEQDLIRALMVFQEEYAIPIGRLRPSDPLEWFNTPPKTRNPIAWIFAETAFEDRLSELNYHLKKCRRELTQVPLRSSPKTLRDYVLACCGA